MTDRKAVEDHDNGIRYGGKILSLIPAPDGWFVGTQVTQHKGGEIERSAPQVHPLIAWALVDAMYQGGDRVTRVEPLFLNRGTITHESQFRWNEGAGDVDEEGWRTLVAVDVIPAPGAVADPPAYGLADEGPADEPSRNGTAP
ncbi:hypothetical protein [Streptomyces sp. KN37]|uniref:hypothetical protein n=1 Tax=Streptomyces sp. KN37 TaxID=3090667 RepID=UPI002A74FEB1|nr:hypothetical protein [Streptomyces sp. KN37]WPO69919.1 hypothetical protein R9806_04380 [Streptomyces sp. KN37]